MNACYSTIPIQRTLRYAAAVLIFTTGLFGSALVAHAQTTPNCMQDNWAAAGNKQNLQCTAKEVFIDEDPDTGDKLIDVTILDGCDGSVGDTATVDIVASIHFNSDRLDVGVYSALDGGDALFGECAVDILDPLNQVALVDGPGSTTVVGTTGSFDVKPTTPPTQDMCGDAMFTVGGGGNLDDFSFQTLTLACVDEDRDGFLDFSTCFSWRVPGSDDFCDGTQSDVYPGTPSKCFCETTNIDVPIPGRIVIQKMTVDLEGDPLSDETLFGFTLTSTDGTTPSGNPLDESFSLQNGQAFDTATDVAADMVPLEGTYAATETVPDNWALSVSCTSDNSTPDDPADDQTFTYTNGDPLILGPGETLTCTFTNQLVFVPDPGISIVKTVVTQGDGKGWNDTNTNNVPDAGETIDYTFDVTNTGNVTLTDVTVADPLINNAPNSGTVDCLATALTVAPDPGSTTTCSATYTLTQADIDSGFTSEPDNVTADQLDNIATAMGTDPDGTMVDDSDDAAVDFPGGVQLPAIDLDKTGTLDVGADGIATPGDLINYSFTITNTGNVTLSGVDLTDAGLTSISAITDNGGDGVTTMAPGAIETATGTYAITQADIDAGVYDNTATTTGDCPQGPVDCVTDDDPHSEPIPQGPGIELIKTGSLDITGGADSTVADPGDVITYSFTVTNSGNVTLTNVTLADTIGGVTISGGPIASLAPGASDTGTFSGSYAITQDDIDSGSFFNTATATGQCTAAGCPVTDPDSHTEPIPQGPAIELIKTGSLDITGGADSTVADPGDVITYSFTVTNSGNVTLTNVTLADTIGGVTISGGPIASLAPGASDTGTFSGSYAITQDDIDSGSFFNTATATGQCSAAGCPVTDPDSHTEPIPQGPAIELIKTGSLDITGGADSTVADPGDVITYSFTVTNSGNVTLTNVTLADTIGGVTISGGPIASLAPGASDTGTFSGSYAITQDDIDSGSFFNTATATGQCTAAGCPVTDPDSHTEPIPQTPAIELIKTGNLDLGGDGIATPGDLITYSFTVTNSGNVTLTNVTVADLVGGVTVSGGPLASLAPGASDTGTFSGSYAITQDDIDSDSFFNTAEACGNSPTGEVCDPDDHDEPIPQTPAIELIKTGNLDLGGDGIATPGDLITYSFTVTNSGNVTLTNVTVADLVGGVTVSGGPLASLAPGASDTGTFSGSYAITQDDIDSDSFFNTAEACGNSPTGEVCDPDDHDEPIPQTPAIELIKTGNLDLGGDGIATPGDLITYSFTVTNSGNVTLTNVTVADLVGGVTVSGGPLASLAPGASDTGTFSGSYAITQDDIDSDSFFNTAEACGNSPTGEVCDPDDHDEPIPQTPAIELIKTGNLDLGGDGIATPGDLITYSFTVTNSGNVTLTNVTVADLVGGVTVSGGPLASLAPGASDTGTFSGSYAITQDDIDSDSFFNTAEACGNSPTGEVCDPDDHDEPIPQTPAIDIEKTPDIQSVTLGADAAFMITVTNTGNVTLTNVTVTDALVPNCEADLGSLAPEGSTSYSCTLTGVTEPFTNVAIAEGQCTATGCPVSDTDDAEVVVVADLCVSDNPNQRGTPPSTLLVQYDGTDPEVWIIVEHPKALIFDGAVANGGSILLDRRGPKKLNPELTVFIYSDDPDDGGQLIDTFTIHTSCSQPLFIGQMLGTDQDVAKITILGEPI